MSCWNARVLPTTEDERGRWSLLSYCGVAGEYDQLLGRADKDVSPRSKFLSSGGGRSLMLNSLKAEWTGDREGEDGKEFGYSMWGL